MNIDLSLLSLEISTAALGITILVLGLLIPRKMHRGLYALAVLGFLGIAGVGVGVWNIEGTLFDGMYIVDKYATFFKILFLSGAFLVTLGSSNYVAEMRNKYEYYSLLAFATVGMMVMVSAGDFITLFVGLELMAIAFYILVCYRKTEAKSVEAGIKYILLSAVSSAVLLYGLSLVYGYTGSIVIYEVGVFVKTNPLNPILIIGLTMLVAGLGFKISAVPFHMWSPDIYEGAPTPITSYLALGSKAASFALLIRIFMTGLSGVWVHWVMLFAVLAALTMILGNLIAIPQTNVKRMLAYSSVAQAGYMLVGMVAVSQAGIKGIMFYAFLYVFATVGAFTVVTYYYTIVKSDEISDYAGLSQRSPLMAAVLVVSMLSMAGIPPLAGFVGKVYLFTSIAQDYLWLMLLGFIMSMVSVYYYLRLTLVMYRDPPADPEPIKVPGHVTITLIVALLATIVIGVYPNPLSEVVNIAAQSFFR